MTVLFIWHMKQQLPMPFQKIYITRAITQSKILYKALIGHCSIVHRSTNIANKYNRGSKKTTLMRKFIQQRLGEKI